MASKRSFIDWNVGQFACVRAAFDAKDGSKWYFAEIARIDRAKTWEETTAEVYLYSVPELYAVEDGAEILKDLFPSLIQSRETVMLARLSAGIEPKKEHRYSRTVRVRLSDLCKAEPAAFLSQLTEGRTYAPRPSPF